MTAQNIIRLIIVLALIGLVVVYGGRVLGTLTSRV